MIKVIDVSAPIAVKKFDIYYMREDFFRDGSMGTDWLAEHGKLPNPWKIADTHIELKTLEYDHPVDLEQVFHDMQGEVWSPNGEARELILGKGLRHTSMSVGDIIHVAGEHGGCFIVDSWGFKKLEA
jgi:hypothetical protein